MWSSFPLFGSALVLCVLLAASYTFLTGLAAGATGRIRTLFAARLGAYATVGFIATAVLCLAYAFQSHDFRLRYVAGHSDRSMPAIYLLTALWGGQDGSILWWLFLLGVYIFVCLKWLGKKHLELQPYVLATLMAVVFFFGVLMAFPANPFATGISGAAKDGVGMNALLQDFYMIIHPPSLYIGFVGCTIPFAFAVAALVTGRLGNEWVHAVRKWMLFAWMFLGIGNTLGMLWAYVVLGWGGYWAWDPVENAAFMPFLVASAYLHSAMIQERRGLFKVWNVFLVCLTFFMTIFGTFLTRSGAIASVHAFAQSSIGNYFVVALAILVLVCFSLILYRWPELRDLPLVRRFRWAALSAGWLVLAAVGPGIWLLLAKSMMPLSARVMIFAFTSGAVVYVALEIVFRRMTANIPFEEKRPSIESIFSREFTFLLNNFALLGFMAFVLVATTFPMLSDALWDEKVTVGPPYYNAWVQPLGLIIFTLMGVGTLFGWKKTSTSALKRAFVAPVVATVLCAVLHLALGRSLGFPAIVWGDAIYEGLLGSSLRNFNAVTPLLGMMCVVFNLVIIIQEFVMLYRARAKSGAGKKTPAFLYYAGLVPGFLYTMVTLPATSRRRYGGYIVHLGLIVMLFGFIGQSWNVSKETSLSPNQSYQVEQYEITYKGPRMEVDATARMIFADVTVKKNGKDLGPTSPAKYIYKKSPESPVTKPSTLHTARDDFYLVVGNINPQTKVAAFQIHINPLVTYIWLGLLVLLLGSFICLWPELQPNESRVWQFARGTATATFATFLGVLIAMMPTQAFAWQTTGSHVGTVHIENEKEREIFSALRCMCGTCARDALSSCACGTADETRERIRAKIAQGVSRETILNEYAAEFGTAALSVPPNQGATRAIYMLPLVAVVGAGAGLGFMLFRWRKNDKNRAPKVAQASSGDGQTVKKQDDYDARLDEELKDLDGRE
ncbi:MAG: cytochrome c-type biogenesis CcmF C-terminal domain-containing protein [Polyangiaceae bacterium]